MYQLVVKIVCFSNWESIDTVQSAYIDTVDKVYLHKHKYTARVWKRRSCWQKYTYFVIDHLL